MEQIATSSLLQQRLKFILQSRQGWVYSIFWKAMEDGNGSVILYWGDGHFSGNKSDFESNDVDQKLPNQQKFGNNEETGIYGLLEYDVNAGGYEWFYMVSLMRSFVVGEGIVGRVFGRRDFVWLTGDDQMKFYECERVKEGHLHGIKTMVCLSTPCGVVELGSLDVINQDSGLIQLTRSLFGAEITCNTSLQVIKQPSNEFQLPISDPSVAAASSSLIIGITSDSCPEKEAKREPLTSQCPLLLLSTESGSHDSDGNYTKKRARKQPTSQESPGDRVKSERQRRERLNQRFYALRSVVPTVSRMDKASLLADAVSYIMDLKAKVDNLESKLKQVTKMSKPMDNIRPSSSYSSIKGKKIFQVDVKVAGSEAMILVQSPHVDHPVARLMDALRDLEFQIDRASVSSVQEMVYQNVVVRIPNGLANEEIITTALVKKMQN